MMRWLLNNKSRLTFAGLIAVGIGLHFWPSSWPPDWPWLGEVKALLGHALIVAGILGATVDSFLKAELIRDVGSIFIGWALPQEVRNYIREVSQTSLVRHCRVEYKFTVDGDHVIVDVTNECDVFNFSTGIKPYRPSLDLDTIEKPDHSTIQYEVTHRGKRTRYQATDFDGTKYKTDEKYTVNWKSPKLLRLLPQDVNQPELKPACVTRWAYRLRMPLDYTAIESVGTPTLGILLTINAPASLTAFCRPTPGCIHANGSNQWHFQGLFMPGQHVRLYWFPKEHA